MATPYNFNDLTGKRFGRLTVVSRSENKSGKTCWHCICDCGNEKDILAISLTRGLTKSCGCLHNEELSRRNLIDLTGKKFGRLTVLKRDDNQKGKDATWVCKCDCGNLTKVTSGHLKDGHTKSCGCLSKERMSEITKTHGMTNTRIYRIYHKMHLRCYSKVNPAYPSYGGRGITICPEWLGEHGLENFAKWSFENGYSDNLSIDRIDNNKGYSPENCRWATAKEQANNTRSTVFLTYKGETKPVSEWSKITGIPQDRLSQRKRSGWTDEECIETPLWGRMGPRKKKQIL